MSIFMKIEGIKGESSDINHQGWLDILLLNWKVSRKITSATSTRRDRESTNASISDLVIIRRMDKATPNGRGTPNHLNMRRYQDTCLTTRFL